MAGENGTVTERKSTAAVTGVTEGTKNVSAGVTVLLTGIRRGMIAGAAAGKPQGLMLGLWNARGRGNGHHHQRGKLTMLLVCALAVPTKQNCGRFVMYIIC